MNDLELTQQTNEELKANDNIELLDNNNEETKEIEEITDSLIESYVDESSTYKVLREHIYRNQKDEPSLRVIRNDTSNTNNKFTIYHFENGEWKLGLSNTQRIPYNLPQLIEAVEKNKPIFITQGEKDADTITELLENKAVATTAITSSTKKWKYEYNDYLKSDSLIIVLQDDTEKGKEFAENIGKKLMYKCKNSKKLSIEKIKVSLKILDTDVTDVTEIRERLQDDEKLRKILNRILDKLNA